MLCYALEVASVDPQSLCRAGSGMVQASPLFLQGVVYEKKSQIFVSPRCPSLHQFCWVPHKCPRAVPPCTDLLLVATQVSPCCPSLHRCCWLPHKCPRAVPPCTVFVGCHTSVPVLSLLASIFVLGATQVTTSVPALSHPHRPSHPHHPSQPHRPSTTPIICTAPRIRTAPVTPL